MRTVEPAAIGCSTVAYPRPMGLFHKAIVTPSKPELVEQLVRRSSWAPAADTELEVVGAFRFDDPEGQVGIETHLVRAGDEIVQVPLTYRPEPLADADDAFVATTEHTVLGTRWVYDGLGDERYLIMVAAVAMTGQGEALGMAEYDGRWVIAPANVRIEGGGWGIERPPVDRLERVGSGEVDVFRNERFELRFHRRPVAGARPHLGLTARWEGHDPVVLAQVIEY